MMGRRVEAVGADEEGHGSSEVGGIGTFSQCQHVRMSIRRFQRPPYLLGGSLLFRLLA